jgi:hypothetical protein
MLTGNGNPRNFFYSSKSPFLEISERAINFESLCTIYIIAGMPMMIASGNVGSIGGLLQQFY